jgi:ribosomal protein S18 acetylase RimI-like enzyme
MIKKWIRFEDNENSWFALWSEVIELKCSQIIINQGLRDDPLFNHTTKVKCKTEEIKHILDESIPLFRKRNVSPCFFVSTLINQSNFEQELIDRGFNKFDIMDVLEKVGGTSFDVQGDIKVELIDSELLNTWISIFTNSFMIPNDQSYEYKRRINNLTGRPDIDFFLANLNKKPVGCAALFSKNKIGGIYSLGTLKEFRKKGVASKLIEYVIKSSESRNNEYHILQTLGQDSSTDFYLKNNFKIAYSKKIYVLK